MPLAVGPLSFSCSGGLGLAGILPALAPVGGDCRILPALTGRGRTVCILPALDCSVGGGRGASSLHLNCSCGPGLSRKPPCTLLLCVAGLSGSPCTFNGSGGPENVCIPLKLAARGGRGGVLPAKLSALWGDWPHPPRDF
ncbi:hypothetical protein PBY51_020876 [Eleginops maclovinus]|uniref:Uncharacterized protein n=1 Tax=Eleginops maclovinus TaxID=56733 RepID=A0AAN7XED5_ELEMC|nr:hypothetical protein PBY51_020876 [Eleginops maclovinus]